MEPELREQLSDGYCGQLKKALDRGDFERARTLVQTVGKQFFMMQRTLRRIMASLTVPTLDEFRATQDEIIGRFQRATENGDADDAREILSEMEMHHQTIHDLAMHWFAQLLSEARRIYGEEGLERMLRKSGEEFAGDFEKWSAMTAEELVSASSFMQLSHPHGWLKIDEDDEKYTLRQGCGTGGRMINEGHFDGSDAYERSTKATDYSIGKAGMPTYCLHCTVWNTLQSSEKFGRTPWVIDHPLDDSCTVHIYKDQDDVPADYLSRLRKEDTQ